MSRKKKKITKRELETLRRAAAILNSINGDLYEDLIEANCQPSTACNATGEIVSAIENFWTRDHQ